MKLSMWCQMNAANGGNAPGVGVTRTVRLQIVPKTPAVQAAGGKPAQPEVPAPDADKFKDGEGGCVFEMVNVTPEVAAQFEVGGFYTVDINPPAPAVP